MLSSVIRRDRLQILTEILYLCKSPQAKTRIMQKTNTAYNSLQNHLLKLKELGLIDLQSGTSKYAITQRGLDFLEKLTELQELLTPEEQIILIKTNKLIQGRKMAPSIS